MAEIREGAEVLRDPQADAHRLRVLLVGQGPPTKGGIPSFVSSLLDDEVLASEVRFDFLNTTPLGAKRPAAATVGNVRQLVTDALGVFRRSRRADIVHLNVAPAPTLPLIRALVLSATAKLRVRRVVLHAHTGRLHAFTSGLVYRVALRIIVRLVDAFVVVSEIEEQAVLRATGRKPVRLPNGVPTRTFETGPKVEDPVQLVFVGTVCERKGLLDLAEALHQLEERGAISPDRFRITIVGDSAQEGPDVFDRIVREFRHLGLEHVGFTGAVEHDAVKAVLAGAAIFCLPSHWEGFPLSLLEAMAASCAPIATDVGDVNWILDRGRAGIVVPPKQPRALADAIERLLSDPEDRHRLGHAARRRVEEAFDQRRLAERLTAIYRGTAGGDLSGHSM
jgi:glycosyltransferase involved in cell wall biosynthesis